MILRMLRTPMASLALLVKNGRISIIVLIDHNFFQALSSKDALKNNPPSHDHSPNHAPNRATSLDDSANPSPKPDADLEAVYEELDEKVTSGEFLYIDKATLDSPKV